MPCLVHNKYQNNSNLDILIKKFKNNYGTNKSSGEGEIKVNINQMPANSKAQPVFKVLA